MLIYQLVVIPLPETRDYLSSVFSGCPFDLDLSAMRVEITSSAAKPTADITRTYEARVTDLNIYYDSQLGMSGLIMSLHSPNLRARFTELQAETPHQWHDKYYPHATLKEPFPPLRKTYKNFVNSVGSGLVHEYSPSLWFGVETVMTRDLAGPEDIDYYRTMEEQQGSFLR
jgi:hypothetical protein